MATYTQLEQIGEGGFCEVFRCEGADGIRYAQKQLRTDSPDDVNRFVKEVRILDKLDHPNVVSIIDVQLTDEPFSYVMPFYDGSLDDALAGLVGDEERIRAIFSRVLDGLEYAHAQGVIHRDLKPQNILLNSDTDVVISDFGLGRRLDAETTRQTVTGMGMGTLAYMPPEQLTAAKEADERSDVFALGKVLHAMFGSADAIALADYEGVPAPIQALIQKCTEPNPARRFESVSQLKRAWLALFDAQREQDQRQRAGELLAELATTASFDEDECRELVGALQHLQGDSDFVHKALMVLPSDAVAALEAADLEGFSQVLRGFVDFTANQGWSFDYTDRIGDWCASVYPLLSNATLKASLFFCAANVGCGHNRWRVEKQAASMLTGNKSAAEIVALRNRLEELHPTERQTLAEYLVVGQVPTGLRDLFDFG